MFHQLNEVKILLKHATKEDVEERNGFGWSPLYYASSRNHPNIIKLLIDAGADVNGTMEHNGDTPVIVASENDSAEALEYLIKQGADISVGVLCPVFGCTDLNLLNLN